MVSSGGLSRIPGSRHLGTFGTLLGSLPERQLYLSSDAPQILTVLSSLPLASHLASGLHVTALTQLKAFKSYVLFPLQKKNSLRTTDLLCKHDGNAMETRIREISVLQMLPFLASYTRSSRISELFYNSRQKNKKKIFQYPKASQVLTSKLKRALKSVLL